MILIICLLNHNKNNTHRSTTKNFYECSKYLWAIFHNIGSVTYFLKDKEFDPCCGEGNTILNEWVKKIIDHFLIFDLLDYFSLDFIDHM